MTFEKLVVIDCKNHMLGRLASVVAKEVLKGQNVVLVRTEEICISGSLFRNKLKMEKYFNKRTNTNPKKGPIHYRAPARLVWKVIRGMLAHKTARGTAALERVKLFEGVPHPYDRMKRMVVPNALRVTHLRPGRKYTVLSRVSHEMGWKHKDLIGRLENKRKDRAALFYQRKQAKNALAAKAQKLATAHNMGHPVVKGKYNDLTTQLAELGY